MNGFNALTITKTCEEHDHYGMQDHLCTVSPKNPKQAVVVVKLLKELWKFPLTQQRLSGIESSSDRFCKCKRLGWISHLATSQSINMYHLILDNIN